MLWWLRYILLAMVVDASVFLVCILDKVLQVVYGGDDPTKRQSLQLLGLNDTESLSTVVPGDFNGDLVTDFLLVYKKSTRGQYKSDLCVGSKSTITHYTCMSVSDSKGQPMILEYVVYSSVCTQHFYPSIA